MEELKKEMNDLLKLKGEYQLKIKVLEKQIKDIQHNIYKTCEIENDGHEWIMEVETGIYGETFYYCKNCDLQN